MTDNYRFLQWLDHLLVYLDGSALHDIVLHFVLVVTGLACNEMIVD